MSRAAILAVVLAMAGAGTSAGTRDLLFWAPYGAGSPDQAASTMEDFARYLEGASGWPAGSISAVYANTVEAGLESIAADAPGFLVVPAPVFLHHNERLAWRPLLFLVTDSAEAQRYSLYGPPGSSLESLTGGPLAGDSTYDPAFVAALVLGRADGDVPYDLQPTARPLSAVRRAAQGERLLVLLDEGQRLALDVLPAGVELDLLAESPWMPAGIVVAGPTADASDAETIREALARASADAGAEELLRTMKIRRFDPAAQDLLTSLGRSYDAARPPEQANKPAG